MTNLPEKLRLKGMAEEDIYFARRDRELIEALRWRRGRLSCRSERQRRLSPGRDNGSAGGVY